MKARTVVLVALAAGVMLAAGSARRPNSAGRPARPVPKRGGLRARSVALAGLALTAAVVLTALGAWRLGFTDEPALGRHVSAAGAPAAPTIAPRPTRPIATPAPGPTAPAPVWRLLAGGDVLMDRSEAAGFDPFAGLVPSLATAELAAVNVEMAIATGGRPADKAFVFRAPPSAARTIAAAGVDVGNLGNNHALDFGIDALYQTMASLRAAGVAPVGAGANESEAYAPESFEIAGVRVAVIGASRVLPTVRWAARAGPGLASAYYEDRLVEAVRSAKVSHDVVIVMVHWGIEGAPCPNRDQERLGAALLQAGASVVLGSHPHVLQPIVLRDGGLIAYSLGNFVWHPRSGPTGETGVLEVRFEGSRVSGYQLYPHVLDGRGAPVPAGPAAAWRIQAAVQRPCL